MGRAEQTAPASGCIVTRTKNGSRQRHAAVVREGVMQPRAVGLVVWRFLCNGLILGGRCHVRGASLRPGDVALLVPFCSVLVWNVSACLGCFLSTPCFRGADDLNARPAQPVSCICNTDLSETPRFFVIVMVGSRRRRRGGGSPMTANRGRPQRRRCLAGRGVCMYACMHICMR